MGPRAGSTGVLDDSWWRAARVWRGMIIDRLADWSFEYRFQTFDHSSIVAVGSAIVRESREESLDHYLVPVV